VSPNSEPLTTNISRCNTGNVCHAASPKAESPRLVPLEKTPSLKAGGPMVIDIFVNRVSRVFFICKSASLKYEPHSKNAPRRVYASGIEQISLRDTPDVRFQDASRGMSVVFIGSPSRAASGDGDGDDYDSDVTYDPRQGPPPKRRAANRHESADDVSRNSSSDEQESTDFTPIDSVKLQLVREKVTEANATPEGDKMVLVEVSSRPNRWDFDILGAVRRFDASNATFELFDGSTIELQSIPDKGVRTVLVRPNGSYDTFGVVRFLGSGEEEPIAEFLWHS
jgi:hypothetical protein